MEYAPVSRRSLFALGATALTILSITATSVQAEHDHIPYRACVTAEHGAWLFAYRCYYHHHHRCMRPVRSGLAFRVIGQKGGYLLVRNNLRGRGWIELNSVRFAPQAYCRAAGI
jgi:hypothetical protein